MNDNQIQVQLNGRYKRNAKRRGLWLIQLRKIRSAFGGQQRWVLWRLEQRLRTHEAQDHSCDESLYYR